MSGQSYPPVSRLNSQAGLQTHTDKPIQCRATLDDTQEGGLFHRCNQVAGHDGAIHQDGHGQFWDDQEALR